MVKNSQNKFSNLLHKSGSNVAADGKTTKLGLQKGQLEIPLLLTTFALLVFVPINKTTAQSSQSKSSDKLGDITLHEKNLSSSSQVAPSVSVQPSSTALSPSVNVVSKTATSTGGSSNNNSSTTSMSVNGTQINVPANGSLNQTINNGNSQTNVQISNSQSTSGSNFSSNVTSTGGSTATDYSSQDAGDY